MLAIQQSKTHRGICIPNVLPCRINHNGPVNASKRYWSPTESQDGNIASYFRGRKLYGRKVKVPEGYKGVVLSSTERKVPKQVEAKTSRDDEGHEDEEQIEDVEIWIMEEKAEFGEAVVWGHEVLPGDMADPYVRGVEEWIAFAEQIHSHPSKVREGNVEAKQS